MYFWQIEKLKQAMTSQPLSERETLPYLVAFVALSSTAVCVPQEFNNVWDYLGAGWTILLAVFGTIHIYRQNGGAEGRHFLQRYFAIGWVVTIRWLAVTILVVAAYYSALVVAGDDLEETYWYEPLLFGIVEMAVYWRIGHHVRDLAQRTKPAVAVA